MRSFEEKAANSWLGLWGESHKKNGFSCGRYAGMNFVHFDYFNECISENEDKQKRKPGKIKWTGKYKGSLYCSGTYLCFLLPESDQFQDSWPNLHKRNTCIDTTDLRETLSQNIKTVDEPFLGPKHICLCALRIHFIFLFHVFVFIECLYQMEGCTVPLIKHFVMLFTKKSILIGRKYIKDESIPIP